MINYFVSSTFSDMQAERDAINSVVIPSVRAHGYDSGVAVAVTDLRRGIDTTALESREIMRRILSVCMQELDACHPHVIILLGDRYGSTPSREELYALRGEGYEEFSDISSAEGKSVTELEIMHATELISKMELSEIPFTVCIREPLSKDEIPLSLHARYFSLTEEDREKMRALKQGLIERFPDKVMHYSAKWDGERMELSGLEEFAEKLSYRLISQIDAETEEEKQSHLAIQYNNDKVTQERLLDIYIPRGEITDALRSFLSGRGAGGVALLCGDVGVGKSAIMASLAHTAETDFHVIYQLCGNGGHSLTAVQMLEGLVWRMEKLLGVEHISHEGAALSTLQGRAATLGKTLAEDRKILVLLDGIERLSENDSDSICNIISPLLGLGGKCKVIMAISENARVYGELSSMVGVHTVYVTEPEHTVTDKIVRASVKSLGRELPEDVVKRLCSVCAYRTPLYIDLLLARIEMISRFDYCTVDEASSRGVRSDRALFDYISKIIEQAPDTEREMTVELLEGAARVIGFPHGADVLALIASVRSGLRIEDAVAILHLAGVEVTPLDVTVYLRYLSPIAWVDGDGNCSFTRPMFKEVITRELSRKVAHYAPYILEYLASLPICSRLKLSELLPLAVRLGDADSAACFLAECFEADEQSSGDSDGDKYECGTKSALFSLSLAYREADETERGAMLEALMSCIDSAGVKDLDTAYGVCAALLTVRHSLLSRDMRAKDYRALMEKVYSTVKISVYPYRALGGKYLRLTYMLAEACGMLVGGMEAEEYYNEFLSMASEYGDSHALTERERTDSLRDMSMVSVRLAELYSYENMQLALRLYDRANELISSREYSRAYPEESKRLVAENTVARAECLLESILVGEEIVDVNGYGRGELKAILPSLIAILKKHINDKGENIYSLLFCCRTVARCYRVLGDTKHEGKYLTIMYNKGIAALEHIADPIALDLVRWAEVNLASSESFTPDISRRIELLHTAMMRVRGYDIVSFSAAVDTVKGSTALAMLRQLCSYIDSLSIDDGVQLDEQLISLVSAVLDDAVPQLALIEETAGLDETEALIDKLSTVAMLAVRQALSKAKECFDKYDWECAYNSLERAHKLLTSTEPVLSFELEWLALSESVCKYGMATAHNIHVARYNGERCSLELEARADELIYSSSLFTLVLRGCVVSGSSHLMNKYFDEYRSSYTLANAIRIAWVRVGAQCLTDDELRDKFIRYLEIIGYNMHGGQTGWLEMHEQGTLSYCRDESEHLGRWLCENIDSLEVRKLIYLCTLYEETALEYAYRHGMREVAHLIVEDGYDRYLEMPTLYLIRKYERRAFEHYLKDVKYICLERLLEQLRYYPVGRDTPFARELADRCVYQLSLRDKGNADDKRNIRERQLFKYLP